MESEDSTMADQVVKYITSRSVPPSLVDCCIIILEPFAMYGVSMKTEANISHRDQSPSRSAFPQASIHANLNHSCFAPAVKVRFASRINTACVGAETFFILFHHSCRKLMGRDCIHSVFEL